MQKQSSPNTSQNKKNKPTTTPKTYSISEITKQYKELNKNLSIALDQISIIYEAEYLEESDIELFKKLDINFVNLPIAKDEVDLHGDSIYISIFETLFEESLEKAKDFFCFYHPDFWIIRLEECNKLFIKVGLEVSFMLKFFNTLYNTLKEISYLSESDTKESTEIMDDYETPEILDFLDFDNTITTATKITDLKERINFYHNEIAARELFNIQHGSESEFVELCNDFIKKCNQAIQITTTQLNNLIQKNKDREVKNEKTELSNPAIQSNLEQKTENETPVREAINSSTKNAAFTTSRQVLAINYLLNEIDRKGISQIDKTEKAKFIEFLTGKNYNNIYKFVLNPFKGLDSKNPKTGIKDLEYIMTHFEKLNMYNIVEKIKSDMIED